MTLDISLEGIEADFRMAERGGQVADLAMARAQVRATLLAAQPADHQGRHEAPETPTGNYITWHNSADIRIEEHPVGVVYIVPSTATWKDRVTAAAMLLGIPVAYLEAAVRPLTEKAEALEAPTEEDARAGEPDEEEWVEPENGPGAGLNAVEDDVDADFFAEAKRARRKK